MVVSGAALAGELEGRNVVLGSWKPDLNSGSSTWELQLFGLVVRRKHSTTTCLRLPTLYFTNQGSPT